MPLSLMAVHSTVTELKGALLQDGAVPATVKVQLEISPRPRLIVQLAVDVVVTVFIGVLEGKERVLGLKEKDDTLPIQGAMFNRPKGAPIKAGTARSTVATTLSGAMAGIAS
jgi:hypothetical protein